MTPPPPSRRPAYFPRDTATFRKAELPAWRVVSRSAIMMGAATGVFLRLFRAVALSYGVDASWAYVGVTLAAPSAALFGMLTLHLANFPVRRWPKHAALFALAEVGAEAAVSAVLIALGTERLGSSGRAGWADLPAMAARTAMLRGAAIAVFALALAGVVQLVRTLLGRRRPPRHAG